MSVLVKCLFAIGVVVVGLEQIHGERPCDQDGQPNQPALMKLIQHLIDDYNRHCDVQHRLRLQTSDSLEAKRSFRTTKMTTRRITPTTTRTTTTTTRSKNFESFENVFTTPETLYFDSEEDRQLPTYHGDVKQIDVYAKKSVDSDTDNHKDRMPVYNKKKSNDEESDESSVFSKLDWLFRKQTSGRSRQSILKELSLNKDIFVIKKEPVYVLALKCMNKNSNKKD